MTPRYRHLHLTHEARTRPVRRFERVECVHGPSLAVEEGPDRFICARCGKRVPKLVHTEQGHAA